MSNPSASLFLLNSLEKYFVLILLSASVQREVRDLWGLGMFFCLFEFWGVFLVLFCLFGEGGVSLFAFFGLVAVLFFIVLFFVEFQRDSL